MLLTQCYVTLNCKIFTIILHSADTCSFQGEPILLFYWWGLGWAGFMALQCSNRWCGDLTGGLKRNRSCAAEPDTSVVLSASSQTAVQTRH